MLGPPLYSGGPNHGSSQNCPKFSEHAHNSVSNFMREAVLCLAVRAAHDDIFSFRFRFLQTWPAPTLGNGEGNGIPHGAARRGCAFEDAAS